MWETRLANVFGLPKAAARAEIHSGSQLCRHPDAPQPPAESVPGGAGPLGELLLSLSKSALQSGGLTDADNEPLVAIFGKDFIQSLR